MTPCVTTNVQVSSFDKTGKGGYGNLAIIEQVRVQCVPWSHSWNAYAISHLSSASLLTRYAR